MIGGPSRREDLGCDARLDAAEKRDEVAQARDRAALGRDQAAVARNLVTAERDAAHMREDGARAVTGAEVILRAAGQRKRAARHRAQAAEQGALADQDRGDAARDREAAACERLHALVDREILAQQLAITEIDSLTGARARAAGLIDLDRELERCRRTGGRLVVAYIDIVGLKTTNDTEGHGAGDALLKRVVTFIKEHLRPYDLIIRLGGDEFLCAMSNTTMAGARQRFDAVTAALAGAPHSGTIRIGFAELTAGQSAATLIERADRDLIDGHRPVHPGPVVPQPESAPRDSGKHSATASLSLTLGGGTSSPVRARAALGAFVGDIDLDQLELLELIVSELVTNSVVHAGADRITLEVRIDRHTVHGEVRDSGPGFAVVDRPARRTIGGLGLVIVDRASNRWGNSDGGRRIWFELDRHSHDMAA
ncbi:MAG: hypothetical protein QOG15_333 [Solirubrobacteraceae bacterium]|nr:hypothetical protein [Solirubrobacteraceae bacterium]